MNFEARARAYDYAQAVEAAGIVELPGNDEAGSPQTSPSELADERHEDRDPVGSVAVTGDRSWGPANAPDAPRRGVCDRRGPYHEFSRRVRVRHHLVEESVLCSCGMEAFLCPDLQDAHEMFGDHVPWATEEMRPLLLSYREPGPEPAPARCSHPLLREPRPYRGEL